MNDDFGIGMGIEAVAAFLQFGTQFGKIVDFAVENNPDGFVLVEDRLMAASQIDDAEPTHSQSDAVFYKDSFVVRTAMHDGLTHSVNSGVIHHIAGMRVNDSRYAAHERSPRRVTDLCVVFVIAGLGAMQVFAGLRHRELERGRQLAAAVATSVGFDSA